MNRLLRLLAALALLTVVLLLGGRELQRASAATPSYDHVVVVMEENHSYSSVIGSSSAPYINSLAGGGANFTDSHGVIHPSVNNYLGFISGQTYSNISDSCTPGGSCSTSAPNLADQLEGSGHSWKGYFEDMPSAGFDAYSSGNYVARHNPLVYFSQIRTNPARNSLMVPFNQFPSDFTTLPSFSFVSPNLCNDMHDCSVATGDTWLKSHMDSYAQWAKTHNSLLIVTWDEDDFTAANHIPTIFYGANMGAGNYSETINHYNVLRTIEAIFGLPGLGNAASLSPISDALGAGSPGAGSPPPSPPSTPPSPSPTPAPPPSPASGSSDCSLTPPIRATFYYPWFPKNWSQDGIDPATRYKPWLGLYDTSYPVIRAQIAAMQQAHIRAAIASWWGQNSFEDQHIPDLLSATANSGDNSVCWTLYYEPATTGGVAQIRSDLAYIANRYTADPHYLHVNGKPVLFVYSRAESSAGDVQMWLDANAGQFYLNLQVFPGYRTAPQPDSWHQYGPAVAEDHQPGFSFSISPGFWKYNESSPRLARDPSRWATNVADMVASREPWQLVTTFNEWGEGTSVEDASDWHDTASGESQYLDALHNSG
jgi:hypothetical protein